MSRYSSKPGFIDDFRKSESLFLHVVYQHDTASQSTGRFSDLFQSDQCAFFKIFTTHQSDAASDNGSRGIHRNSSHAGWIGILGEFKKIKHIGSVFIATFQRNGLLISPAA